MIPTVTTVYLLANITTTFSCVSSIGRPTPAIRWYMVNKTLGYSSADSDISKYAISNTSYSANGDVITSYLILTPSTDDHGKILYCNVSNGYGQMTSDHTPVIVILRLPSKPVIFHNSSTVMGIYRVIENQTVSLTCSSDGNPPPTVTWITPQNLTRTTSVLTITTISTTETGVYTCRANSTLLPTTGQPIDDISTTKISAEVLYPPRPPECRIGNVTVTSNVFRAIRNESFRLTCTSGSNPMPSNYTWTLPLDDRVRCQELLIEALRSIGDDIYDIRIVNLMNPSFQQSLEGSIEQLFKLKILYPVETPTIYYVRPNQPQEINEVNIIRGQTVHLQCNSSSNPQPNYEWSTKEVVSAQGAFWNQTIGTHQVVVCNASNCMDPTGHTTVCQSRVAYLNITAYFPPDTPLLSFTTCGHAFTTSTLKIIEGQSVNVSCSSMSNPDPTYTWNQSKQLQGNTLVIENITLTQNGTYSCTAINIMNTTFDGTVMGENTSTFHLDILVPPRVYHIENKTVILNTNFSVVCPYTVGNPSSTTVVWTRERETHIADS
ncbi:hypothetical protein DPMN_102631 [Dreissena polymorpha]|uniref:Ig-like domain-containing protein n=1 Tax=Dreissena polymorpha TaxID=45954 RepID=A0A9D4LJP6_DREPO|nr:hypothetical protein DPMN_102631 [Dreissena polymorpha]